MPSNSVTIGMVSLILSLGLTPLVRLIALRRGWVARPKSDRWHKQTTALMGGIAIFAAVAVPLVVLSGIESHWQFFSRFSRPGRTSLTTTLLCGTAFLFVVGLIDDFKNMKPHSKLIAQILAAALVTFLGFRLQWFESLTLDTMATLFWIVGITNAFNLIDNMDGLCAGVGMIAAFSLAFLLQPVAPEAVALCVVLAGALAGFLVYNFNPAKIFMGDCGSLVIGFSLSVLTLYFPAGSSTALTAVAVPVLILLVPIMDTTLVTAIRLLSGRKASTGGRDHTSHRLVLIGLTEKRAVLFLYGIGAVAGLAANFVSRNDSLTSPIVIVPMALAIVLMGIYLSQLRVYPEKEFSALRNRSFTPVLLELTYKRQLMLVALDFVLVAFAYYLSYRLRFSGAEFSFYFKVFLKSLPMIIGCKLIVFFLLGIYRGMWGYISTSDVFLLVKASLAGTLLSIAVMTFIYRFQHFSKGIFIIDWIVTTGLLLGVRGSFRMFLESQKRRTMCGDKVLIYGAGRAGELLLREILNNKSLCVAPIGFIDDDPLKSGKNIQGFPVLGTYKDIERLHHQHQIQGILLSFHDANGNSSTVQTELKMFCRDHRIFLRRFKMDLQEVTLEL